MKDVETKPIPDADSLKKLPVVQLVAIIVQQHKALDLLQQEIERLKVSAALDSQTSSKPPSSDLLKKPHKPKQHSQETNQENKPKRQPGGQAGHQGKTRKGFDRINRNQVLQPDRCCHCGSSEFESEPVRVNISQVAQLVERPIEVVEYQRHTCRCKACGQETLATWPERVIPGQDLDAHLQALLGWLGNYAHLSYEKPAELLWELGQIEVGSGTRATTNSRVAQTLTSAVSELQKWVRKPSHVHVDETPWAVKGIKEWLWVAANKLFCWFQAADTRSRAELQTMLGERFCGVISSDDLSVYNGDLVVAQQKCLAHLRRHVQKLIMFGRGVQATIGEVLLELIDEAFRMHRLWLETGDTNHYQVWTVAFKMRVQQAVQQFLPLAGYQAGKI